MNFQKRGQIALPFALSEFVNFMFAGAVPITASRKISLNGNYYLTLKGISFDQNDQGTLIQPSGLALFSKNFVFQLQCAQIMSVYTNPGYFFHLGQEGTYWDQSVSTHGVKPRTQIGLMDVTLMANISGRLDFRMTCGEGKAGSITNFQKNNASFNTSNSIFDAFVGYGGDTMADGSIIFVFEYELIENLH